MKGITQNIERIVRFGSPVWTSCCRCGRAGDELTSSRFRNARFTWDNRALTEVAETLAYTRFPEEHWRRIRTNNAIERLNKEIRRRTKVVGAFPDGKSALMLVAARLKYVADSEWGSRRYLDVSLLDE